MKVFAYILRAIISLVLVAGIGAALSTATVSAARPGSGCNKETVLTFPAWYRGLVNDKCDIQIDNINDLWKIALNILEILLQIAAYVSTGFIVWGGIKYIKSEGEPNNISQAKSAIQYAVVGLVVSFASVMVVKFIAGAVV